MEKRLTYSAHAAFKVAKSTNGGVKITPEEDLDFGNIVQFKSLFLQILESRISHLEINIKNVFSIDDLTYELFADMAQKLHTQFTSQSLIFSNASQSISEYLEESPLLSIYDFIQIKRG